MVVINKRSHIHGVSIVTKQSGGRNILKSYNLDPDFPRGWGMGFSASNKTNEAFLR